MPVSSALEPMAVRLYPLLFALCVVPLHVCADPSLSFAKRVAFAKEVEEQKATAEYFHNGMYPAIGPSLSAAMRECMSHAGASTDKFTVVADITQNGEFIHIAYEPNTNTAACLAAAMASFRAPAPPTCDYGALPIVIDMSIKP